MSRNWIRLCPKSVISKQQEAHNSTIYILREIGPTGFLLKEENRQKVVKVLIGEVNRCSCLDFLKSPDEPCKHICWVFLKKFKLSVEDPVCWQKGLCEREIQKLTQNVTRNDSPKTIKSTKMNLNEVKRVVERREIARDDSCPICQEDFINNSLPTTYCMYGCGNNVHIKCMRIWASHRKEGGVECPFCRTEFGSVENFLKDIQSKLLNSVKRSKVRGVDPGVHCHSCGLCPIKGKVYKCQYCVDAFYLCGVCFSTEVHTDHPFYFSLKGHKTWERVRDRALLLSIKSSFFFSHLQGRSLGASDYEELLALDEENHNGDRENHFLERYLCLFPTTRLKNSFNEFSKSFNRGGSGDCQKNNQNFSNISENNLNISSTNHPTDLENRQKTSNMCTLCKEAMMKSEEIRLLPCCGTWLHRRCVDVWLVHFRCSCPLCNLQYNTSVVQGLLRWKAQRNSSTNDEKHKNKLLPTNSSIKPHIKPDCDIKIVGFSTTTKITPETPTNNKITLPKRCKSNLFEVPKKSINFPELIASKKFKTPKEKRDQLTRYGSSLPTISSRRGQFLNEIELKPFETSILSVKNYKLN